MIGCNLLLSVAAIGLSVSKSAEVSRLQKRVAEWEDAEKQRRDDNALAVARAFVTVLEITDVKVSSLTIQPVGKTPIIELGPTDKGGALIAIKDSDSKTRLQLEVESNGNSIVRHYDRNGVPRTGSGLLYTAQSPSGLPFFTRMDANGNFEKD